MVHHKDRSTLPPDFPEYSLEQAVKILLRAHVFDMENLQTLEAKHATLVDYIEFILEAEGDEDD
jgi:hypothetical protein